MPKWMLTIPCFKLVNSIPNLLFLWPKYLYTHYAKRLKLELIWYHSSDFVKCPKQTRQILGEYESNIRYVFSSSTYVRLTVEVEMQSFFECNRSWTNNSLQCSQPSCVLIPQTLGWNWFKLLFNKIHCCEPIQLLIYLTIFVNWLYGYANLDIELQQLGLSLSYPIRTPSMRTDSAQTWREYWHLSL